jgi:K+-transporting ATPase ATPase A chain
VTANGWIQIAIFFLFVVAVTKPLGAWMFRVFEDDRQPMPRVFGRLERAAYRACGIDPAREQTWKQYAGALLLFSAIGIGILAPFLGIKVIDLTLVALGLT